MFKKKTVIILGAGASHHFDFPLGNTLLENIIVGVNSIIKPGPSRFGHMMYHTGGNELLKDPYTQMIAFLGTKQAREMMPDEMDHNSIWFKLVDFAKAIEGQTQESIDTFVRQNPTHSFFGKVFTALEVFTKMYERQEHNYNLKDFGVRDINGEPNWYLGLIEHLRDEANDLKMLEQNRISIVTFNYDLSLEHALMTQLGNAELFAGASYKNFIDIFHVNGAPTDVPNRVPDLGSFIFEAAQGLFMYADDVVDEVSMVRREAKIKIKKADKIFAMGFRFEPANVKTLGLSALPSSDHIIGLNYDGNPRLKRRMVDLGIPTINILNGSTDNPLLIHKAIADHYLFGL